MVAGGGILKLAAWMQIVRMVVVTLDERGMWECIAVVKRLI